MAVIYCDQAGAFTVATPLMRGLRERYPDIVLDYLGGEGVRDLEEASPLVDARYSLFGRPDSLERLPGFLARRQRQAGSYALAVNLESDPTAALACRLTEAHYVVRATPDPESDQNPPREGIDRLTYDFWNRVDLLQDYPELSSQYLGEIFCRLARVDTNFTRTELPKQDPGRPIPPVLLSAGGRRPKKLWPQEHWLAVADWCAATGWGAGLLGAPPDRRGSYHAGSVDDALLQHGVLDLRGPALTLPQVAGALAQARVLVTLDSALMHVSAAVGTPTIVMFGDGSPRRIWSPPAPWVTILTPADPCGRCEENFFRNDDCLIPVHRCMLSITPERVIGELKKVLVN